jgi:hypothetical protein
LVANYTRATNVSRLDTLLRKLLKAKADPAGIEAFLNENQSSLQVLFSVLKDMDPANPQVQELRKRLRTLKDYPEILKRLPPDAVEFMNAEPKAAAGKSASADATGKQSTDQRQPVEGLSAGPSTQDLGPVEESIIAQWLYRQAEILAARSGGAMDNSAAFQQALEHLKAYRDFHAARAAAAARTPGMQNVLIDVFPRDLLGKIHIPDLGRFAIPNPWLGLSLPNLKMPGAHTREASSDLPSASRMGNPLTIILAVLAAAGVLFLIWRLLWRYAGPLSSAKDRDRDAAGRLWRLGPWPVKPQNVSTSADLIRAFEYMSVLKLGRRAQSWNHIDIAAALRGGIRNGSDAAGHLASLYEQARYDPDPLAMSESTIQTARAGLSLLVEGNAE